MYMFYCYILQGGVYKAFNTVGVDILADPVMADNETATMMYAGPPGPSTSFDTVTSIITDCGFEPLYVGPSRQARNLESIAECWIHMANMYKDLPYKKDHGARDFAWKVIFR
jgi:predicted dinucleotide-binding enzyme